MLWVGGVRGDVWAVGRAWRPVGRGGVHDVLSAEGGAISKSHLVTFNVDVKW